jgi:methane monooxygenase component A beta chain/propane monooxygenase small subunit
VTARREGTEARGDRRRGKSLGPFHAVREITTVTPGGRWMSEYEVAICRAQSDLRTFDTGGWYVLRRDGSGIYADESTAVRHPDWSEFRDPSAMWQREYVALQAEEEGAIARGLRTAETNGSFDDISSHWCRDVLGPYYEAWACAESALFIALSRCVREALSDTLSMALVFAAVDRARHQQDIANLSLSLVAAVPTYLDGLGVPIWRDDPAMAPTRELVEALLSTSDWVEVAVAIALIVDPIVSTFFLGQFLRRSAPLHGDTVTPTILTAAERDRARFHASMTALVRMLIDHVDDDPQEAWCRQEANRAVIQNWVDRWTPPAMDAVAALFSVVRAAPVQRDAPEQLRATVIANLTADLEALGLKMPECLAG